MAQALAPLKLPGFRYLAGAYTVNELGNWVGEIALAVLVFDKTGSPLATAALFIGMHFLPAFLSQGVVARTEPTGTKVMLPALYLGEAVTFVIRHGTFTTAEEAEAKSQELGRLGLASQVVRVK